MGLTQLEHHSHLKHLLKLEQPLVPYMCSGCKQLGFGTCYVCRKCNFHIHKECALPSSPFYHRFFKDCDFEFNEEPPHRRICDACLKDIKGYAYQCTCRGGNPRDLHASCAKLPETLTGENVTLKLANKIPAKCLKRHSRRNSRKGAKGWAYVSSCRKYCLHVACAKEFIYDAWEKGYFSAASSDNNQVSRGSRMEILVPPGGDAVVSSGEGKVAAKLRTLISVITLIISAIFGDPITAFAAVIIAIAKSLS